MLNYLTYSYIAYYNANEFEQLENILIEWNQKLSVKRPIGDRTGEWVYSRMKTINGIYMENKTIV